MNFTKKFNFNNLLDIDWTKPPFIYILFLTFLATRIPLLNLGYGYDGDAWRVAVSAYVLKNYNIYHTSRFPGYPLPEFVNSVYINYGWIATNSVTMILSFLSVFFFAKIITYLKVKNKGMLTITYAFMPILWINSTNTMDYMWGLSLLIISWYLLIKEHYLLSGAIMGLAISCRCTLVMFLLPINYLMWENTKNIKEIIRFNLVAGIISATIYAPLWTKYGLGFLTYASANFTFIHYIETLGYNVYSGFGILPIITCLVGFFFSAKKLIVKVINKDKYIIFLLLSIVPTIVLYFKVPYEAGYLIPAIPFGLILIEKLYNNKLFVLLCIFLLVNSIITVGAISIDNNGNPKFKTIDEGMIQQDVNNRIHAMQYSEQIKNAKINHSAVVVRGYVPNIHYLSLKSGNYTKEGRLDIENDVHTENFVDPDKDVGYFYELNFEEFKELQKKGYAIYYTKVAERKADYDMKFFGGIPIETVFI